MSDISKRKGKLIVEDCLYENDIELIQKLFSEIVPVRIDHNYATGTFEIYALSKHFDKLEDGGVEIPLYGVIVYGDTFIFQKVQ